MDPNLSKPDAISIEIPSDLVVSAYGSKLARLTVTWSDRTIANWVRDKDNAGEKQEARNTRPFVFFYCPGTQQLHRTELWGQTGPIMISDLLKDR